MGVWDGVWGDMRGCGVEGGGGCGVNWGCGGYGVGGCGTPLIPPLLPPQFADIMQKIEDYIARQPRAAEGNGGGGFGGGYGGVLGRIVPILGHFGAAFGAFLCPVAVWGRLGSFCACFGLGSLFEVVLELRFWVVLGSF